MTIKLDKTTICTFQNAILTRYANNKRMLPRRKTTDPYKIMVSEFMLQQTQVGRVIPKYTDFIAAFPNIKSLERADNAQILRHRSGLGFNRRALYLQQAAHAINTHYNGIVPSTYDALLQLPGIGAYTAGAIMAFAYNRDVVVLDINIKRVHIMMLGLDRSIKDKDLRAIVEQCLPSGQSCDRYNALMDYGATILTAKKTNIGSPSQSPFHGSRRQARGKLLNYILKHEKASHYQLLKIMNHQDSDLIINTMIAEGFIEKHGDIISLTSLRINN